MFHHVQWSMLHLTHWGICSFRWITPVTKNKPLLSLKWGGPNAAHHRYGDASSVLEIHINIYVTMSVTCVFICLTRVRHVCKEFEYIAEYQR